MTSSSPSSSSSSPSSSEARPAPLLSYVSYNHELLKLRLLNVHSDWLYRYKISTERSIDEQRKAEFTRGHSLHVPGFSLSTFPIRRIHSASAARVGQQQHEGKQEGKDEQELDDLPFIYALDAQQSAARVSRLSRSLRRAVMLGSSRHLFRSEDEVAEEREDEAAQQRRHAEDRQRRVQRWKSRLSGRVQQLLSPSSHSAPSSPSAAAASALQNGDSQLKEAAAGSKGEKAEKEQQRSAPFTPARASASPAATASQPSVSVSSSSSSAPAARSSSPVSYSKSPSPPPFPASSVSSLPPSLAFCEECANRIETAWAVCDYCGYDPLAAGDEDEDGAGGKRRKRKRAQRLESLIAQTQQVEKKQKAQEEMRLLAESMSPWSSEDAQTR